MGAGAPCDRAAIALGLLIVAALGLRLAALGSFPRNLMADEADNLAVVYSILYRDRPALFGLDWKPSPAFSMYVASPFVALWGETVLGLRLPAALSSVAALLPLYALYRRQLAPAPSLLALTLLSASVWYLNFSRSGWENVHIVLLTAVAAWLLVRALEGDGWLPWALCGGAASLGLYGYFAGRAILPALLAYAPFALWRRRGQARRTVLGYALLVVVALSLFVPQLPAIRANPAKFNVRAERVSVIRAARTETGYFGREGVVPVLLYQAARNARFFFDGSALGGEAYSPPEQRLQDTRPRYSPFGRALLDPATGLLFAAGLALSLGGGTRYALWWVLLLVPWALTQLLTINTPDAARGIGMLPAVYFFVALSLDRLWSAFAGIRAARPLIAAAVLAITCGTTLTYFSWAGSDEALAAREPAVPLEEFAAWRQTQLGRVRANEPFLTVTGWEAIRDRGRYRVGP